MIHNFIFIVYFLITSLCISVITSETNEYVPNNGDINQVLNLVQNGDLQNALDVISNQLQLSQSDAHTMNELYHLQSLTYTKLNQLDKALFCFQNIKFEDILRTPVYASNYVEILRLMGYFSESESITLQALSIRPNDITLLKNYATLLEALDRVEEVIEIKMKILNLNPSDIPFWLNFNELFVTRERYNESIHLLEQGIKLYPDTVDLMNALAITYLRMSDYDSCYQLLSHANQLDPTHWGVLSNLGTYYHKINQLFLAVEFYKKALGQVSSSNDPSYILNNLGAALMSLRKDEEALSALQKSLEFNQENPNALLNLGTFHQEEGYDEVAKLYFQRTFEQRNNIQPNSQFSFLTNNPLSSSTSSHNPIVFNENRRDLIQRYNVSTYPEGTRHLALLIRQVLEHNFCFLYHFSIRQFFNNLL